MENIDDIDREDLRRSLFTEMEAERTRDKTLVLNPEKAKIVDFIDRNIREILDEYSIEIKLDALQKNVFFKILADGIEAGCSKGIDIYKRIISHINSYRSNIFGDKLYIELWVYDVYIEIMDENPM